jgi:hypothetical protein
MVAVTHCDQRFLSLQSQGKYGPGSTWPKYEPTELTIVDRRNERGLQTFSELGHRVEDGLGASFEGTASWYDATVELDP